LYHSKSKNLESSAHIHVVIPHDSIHTSFLTRMVGEDDPFYLKFWVTLTPLEQKRRLSIDIHS